MTFGNAILYSLLGMLTVFLALVFLMVIIKIMTSIGDKREASKDRSLKAASGNQPEDLAAGAATGVKKDAKPAPGSAGDVKLYNTPPRTAAMLMAIVADEMKTPINELRFISIKEMGKENE